MFTRYFFLTNFVMEKQIVQRLRVLTRPQTGLYRLMMCRCLHMPLPGVRFRFRKDQSWLQIDGRMQPEGCNRCLSKLPFCRDGSVTVSDEALMDRQHKQKTGRSQMRTNHQTTGRQKERENKLALTQNMKI